MGMIRRIGIENNNSMNHHHHHHQSSCNNSSDTTTSRSKSQSKTMARAVERAAAASHGGSRLSFAGRGGLARVNSFKPQQQSEYQQHQQHHQQYQKPQHHKRPQQRRMTFDVSRQPGVTGGGSGGGNQHPLHQVDDSFFGSFRRRSMDSALQGDGDNINNSAVSNYQEVFQHLKHENPTASIGALQQKTMARIAELKLKEQEELCEREQKEEEERIKNQSYFTHFMTMPTSVVSGGRASLCMKNPRRRTSVDTTGNSSGYSHGNVDSVTREGNNGSGAIPESSDSIDDTVALLLRPNEDTLYVNAGLARGENDDQGLNLAPRKSVGNFAAAEEFSDMFDEKSVQSFLSDVSGLLFDAESVVSMDVLSKVLLDEDEDDDDDDDDDDDCDDGGECVTEDMTRESTRGNKSYADNNSNNENDDIDKSSISEYVVAQMAELKCPANSPKGNTSDQQQQHQHHNHHHRPHNQNHNTSQDMTNDALSTTKSTAKSIASDYTTDYSTTSASGLLVGFVDPDEGKEGDRLIVEFVERKNDHRRKKKNEKDKEEEEENELYAAW